MQKVVSLCMFVVLIVSASLPGFAQGKSAPSSTDGSREVGTRFASIEAFTDNNSVFLRWQMEVENRNIGFEVFRMDGGDRTRMTDNTILSSGARITSFPHYGDNYSYLIPNGDPNATYVVVAIQARGRSIDSQTVQRSICLGSEPRDGRSGDHLSESF